MDLRDRRLGMNREISRRDFLNGVGVAIGASFVPGCAWDRSPGVGAPAANYPPAATGMRGAHPGSFEAAHARVQGKRWEVEKTGEHYDLVVVGAGISGLTSAYIYRRDVDPDARILVLDNHDDFGGHAKRNEFWVDDRLLLGFGGTMFIEDWESYPAVSIPGSLQTGAARARHRRQSLR
jgi:spermidine dehydrogenase